MMSAVRATSVALFAFCLFTGQVFGVTLSGWKFDDLGMASLLVAPAIGYR